MISQHGMVTGTGVARAEAVTTRESGIETRRAVSFRHQQAVTLHLIAQVSYKPTMDGDLIKLVNKLQDTFSNLGELLRLPLSVLKPIMKPSSGGELDMHQIADVSTRKTRRPSSCSP